MSQTIEIILDQTTKSATHPPSTLCRMPRTRKIRKHTFTLNHLDRNSAPQSNISPLEEVPAEFTEETHNAKEAFLLFLENGILTHIVKHTNKRMARRNALRYDVAQWWEKTCWTPQQHWCGQVLVQTADRRGVQNLALPLLRHGTCKATHPPSLLEIANRGNSFWEPLFQAQDAKSTLA